MANRYWVGGTGTWNTTSTTNWSASSGGASGASVPTAADNVFFDQAGTYTVTMTGALACLDFTVSAGTVTFATGTAPTLAISGSMSLVAATVWNATGAITFNATTTGKTITTNGVILRPNVVLNGVGGGWTLGSALTLYTVVGGGSTFTVTSGSFSTANFNLTAGSLVSSASTTRSISLGSSTVTLSAATGLDFATTTNLTFNAGTSTINCAVASVSAVINGGGQTFNVVNFNGVPTGSTTVSITGSNAFNTLTVTAPSNGVIRTLSIGGDQTIGTFSTTATVTARLFIRSATAFTTRTLTCTSISLPDCDFLDITLAGAAAGSAPTRAGNCGGNTGIVFPAAKTVYCNSSGSQSWYSTIWATSIGGAPAANNFPLAQDTAVLVNTGAVTTLSFGAWNIGTIDASALTSACTFTIGSVALVYGDWKNGSAVTFSGSGSITFQGRSVTQNILSNGIAWANVITINSTSTTVKLLDNFSGTSIAFQNGTIDLNGKTATVSTTFQVPLAGTKNLTFNGGTLVCSASSTVAFNNQNAVAFTTTPGSAPGKISMTGAGAKTFVAGSSTYNCTISNDGAGALTFTGNPTITTLANSVQPTTILFTAGTTTTITNWSVSGTAGNLVTIGSVTAATHTLSKASGTVSANYLSISNSIATGGAAWYAGANSTNGGGNTGWIFTAPPSGSNAKFLMFF